ncbi:hypothetical protein CEXT_289201 [Caerostris extrusa]|uniref:Uncharacterized protein n=1 Tax=Caerostris extrusa TaxID=172846 RepID=A0AAV4RJL7_CAEEX|nr:hypothetical protein CEXT_289201 [Caerostris extrusa]
MPQFGYIIENFKTKIFKLLPSVWKSLLQGPFNGKTQCSATVAVHLPLAAALGSLLSQHPLCSEDSIRLALLLINVLTELCWCRELLEVGSLGSSGSLPFHRMDRN